MLRSCLSRRFHSFSASRNGSRPFYISRRAISVKARFARLRKDFSIEVLLNFPWKDIVQRLPIYTTYAAGLLAFAHVFITHFFVFQPTYGVSMTPTMLSLDWVLISKYYRRGRALEVGDVVSFRHPVDRDMYAVKRLVGMPGDFVLRDTPGKNDVMLQVPEGHCWVVGDNLKYSRDSRMFGPLPLALIEGKVLGGLRSTTILDYRNGLSPAALDDELD